MTEPATAATVTITRDLAPATAAPWFVRAFRWIVGWRERHEAFLGRVGPGVPMSVACPGSGGGWDDDGALDRTPTTYTYGCERCGGHHEDRRPRVPLRHRLRDTFWWLVP